MRIFVKMLTGLALLIAVLLVAFVAVNGSDEAPTELAIVMGNPQINIVPDADNAFLAMMGFSAPAGQNIVAQGRERVDAHNAYLKRIPDSLLYQEAKPLQSLQIQGEVPACDFAGDSRCWQRMNAEDRAATDRLLKDNAELVGRYQMLLTMSGYFGDMTPNLASPFADFAAIASIGRLLRDAAMQKVKAGGSADTLLALLENDLRLWKRVLAGYNGLVYAMIAIQNIRLDASAISLLLDDPAFAVTAHAEKIRALLTPLAAEEKNLASTLHYEFLIQAGLLRNVADIAHDRFDPETRSTRPITWWERTSTRLIMHPQAMVNRAAENFDRIKKWAALSPMEFIRQKSAFETEKRKIYDFLNFDSFYDPMGKVLTSIGMPELDHHILRLYEMNAYLQLVRAQLEVRLAGLPAIEVPAFLAKHPELFNPYTGELFIWNAEKRTLSFVTQADTPALKKGELFQVMVPLPDQ